mgnify:CR=1 FL=1
MDYSRASLASRFQRFIGAMIDGIISLVIIFPTIHILGVWKTIVTGEELSLAHEITLFIIGQITFLGVNGYLLVKHGQTIGKKLAQTRIIRVSDGTIPPLSTLFGLRVFPISLASQIPIVGSILMLADCLFIFRTDKRCLHDLIAGTKVVNT